MKALRFLKHIGVSLLLIIVLKRLALVDIMRLPHEPGTIPDPPFYYIKKWCIEEAWIGTSWFTEPFCYGVDVRVLLLLIVIGFCFTEAWLRWRRR